MENLILSRICINKYIIHILAIKIILHFYKKSFYFIRVFKFELFEKIWHKWTYWLFTIQWYLNRGISWIDRHGSWLSKKMELILQKLQIIRIYNNFLYYYDANTMMFKNRIHAGCIYGIFYFIQQFLSFGIKSQYFFNNFFFGTNVMKISWSLSNSFIMWFFYWMRIRMQSWKNSSGLRIFLNWLNLKSYLYK